MPARSARRAPRATTGIELDVASVISSPDQVAADTARQLSAALSRSDVLQRTSRALVRGATGSLAITRTACAALSRAARQALAAEPPGSPPRARSPLTTSPVHRSGIRRAEVAGQLFPGVISVFGPVDAAPQAIGMPASSSSATSATTMPGPGRGHPQRRAAGPVTHQAPQPTNSQLATTRS
jgi:hypothetical protein